MDAAQNQQRETPDIDEPEADVPAGTPYVAYGLLTILTAIFACEMFFGIDTDMSKFDPGMATLIGMGGSSWLLTVQEGQWYRGVSAVFLHGGLLHFLGTAVVLFWAGRWLEPLVGHAWFGAIYAVAAVCGSLLSLALNRPNLLSVGASGAIIGLIVATFVCSFRSPKGQTRKDFQLHCVRMLFLLLLTFVPAERSHQVDYGGHLGGAIGGALVSGLILLAWSHKAALPPWRGAAATVAAVWAAGAIYTGIIIGPRYAAIQAIHPLLIPEQEIPHGTDARIAQADALVAKYPRDPHGYYFRAINLIRQRNWAAAEKELNIALGEKEILALQMKQSFHDELLGLLALTLSEQGRDAEARAVAKPACGRSVPWSEATRVTFKRLCS